MDGSDKPGTTNTFAGRARPAVLIWAVAAALAVVAIVVVVIPSTPASVPSPAPPRADLSPLYGRWVRSGQTCDTRRGEMIVTASRITHHEFGTVKSDMTLAGFTVRSPGVFEVKYTSENGSFAAFAPFELKDAGTLLLTGYLLQSDGIWRKC